jgi:desulfoferrodoxin-like iron-binding protein
MLEVGKRYACEVCGTESLVTKPSDGTLACCGQDMAQMAPKKAASAD